MGRRAITAILLASALLMPQALKADDTGLIIEAGVEKKFDKRTSIAFDTEFRSRNDFRTADRISLGISGERRLTPWLRLSAGYQLLIDNNIQKLTYNTDGSYNNWRPSYWATRHRINAALTASYKIGRVNLSLRERWRYTYRPEHNTRRYDFDNNWWEDKTVKEKSTHILRSRLKASWDIPASKFEPWASFEVFNSLSNSFTLDKMRYSAGVDYQFRKRHTFGIFYRYQDIRNNDSDDEVDSHHIGASYKFKF